MGMAARHSQETVYVRKKGTPEVRLKDQHIRKRLREAQPDEPHHLGDRRVARFLEAREAIDKAAKRSIKQHLDRTLVQFENFVANDSHEQKLPTSLMLKADVRQYIEQVRASQSEWRTISIHSKECPTLKSTLKLIVNRFTGDSAVVSDRRLTYDFNVLIDWLSEEEKPPRKLVVVLEDTEGFNGEILRSLISHMHAYVSSGDLPLHLLLNLSIPLPLLEETLSQDNAVDIDVQVLQGSPATEDFLEHSTDLLYNSPTLRLRLSKYLIDKLAAEEMAKAVNQLHYAILGHFAGNPLASMTTVGELREIPDLVPKLPSVHTHLQADATYLDALYSDITRALCDAVPEAEVGGKVLDIAFNPNYRPLLEAALTDPRPLVEGECDRMSVPISVLYQLSRESSIYINIYDFYCAFKSMVRPIPDCADWDRQSMAVFLESITALKMMGVLRDCKRKFECVEKVSWKGV